jgi:tRNA(fMet)-specific endonuclease VapC
MRALLERAGARMGNLEMMIAAHALANKAILVTSDRDFSRVKGLQIADWSR